MRRPLPLGFLALALCPLSAFATSIVPHTIAQRAEASDRVAVVTVLRKDTVVQGDDPRTLRTQVQVLVGEDVKGSGPQVITIAQVGGDWGLWSRHIPGDATFVPGERALVFLRCESKALCRLVALGEGKLAVTDTKVRVHDLFTGAYALEPLVQVIKGLRAAPVVRPAPAGQEAK